MSKPATRLLREAEVVQAEHAESSAIFGHPRGLAVLFLTETWEQFSYYGMRALLVYYMIRSLDFSQASASLIYATYISAAYFTPIFGGIITDRWLGRRRAVAIGSTIMAFGHFAMASEPLFFAALGLIAIGNGLYVPSLASQISGLYRPGDPRRKTAFSIYYVGGNVGAFLAPLACGFVGEVYGWHYGFTVAGVGMLIGLAIYLTGERHLPERGDVPTINSDAATATDSSDERGRFRVLAAVLAVVILFRAAYEQVGNTVALWIADIDRAVGAAVIPMTWFQSLNGLLIIVGTPLVLAIWSRRTSTSTMARMATGAALTAAAYLLLSFLSTIAAQNAEPTAWPWVVLFFVIMTTGELYILPVGLSLFGRLAPRRLAATIVSVWFAAISAGSLLSGFLGTLWSQLAPSAFFLIIAAVAMSAALLCLTLIPAVRRVESRAEIGTEVTR